MKQLEHSKIINRIAKEVLSPYGIFHKGKSRTWLDDKGWSTTMIEFQPSGYSRGTYLNVGVSFHWYLKDYWSFDIGHREKSYIEFENEEQFAPEIESMAKIALEKVLFYRDQLGTIERAKQFIIKWAANDGCWGNYHRGVICGLADDIKKSKEYFDELLAIEHEVNWANELKEKTLLLKELLNENGKFRQSVLEIITETRGLKKLKDIDLNISLH